MSFAYDRRVDVVGTHATPQNIQQRNTYAAATPRQRKVRSSFAVRTQLLRVVFQSLNHHF